ncbi:MAG: hypothetical protein K0S28_1949, partial [Paucimonas sp.]|nr:hypothetical protein [Paucimonas sp.]
MGTDILPFQEVIDFVVSDSEGRFIGFQRR